QSTSQDDCNGHLLLLAFQSGELKIVKEDLEKIKKNMIVDIATVEPTIHDAPNVHAQAIFTNEKTWIGKPAPKSAALPHIKKRKQAIINVESEDNQPQ
ncbi:hypothetical protein C0995_001116, partial [Termitomyces sp. Mi166